MQTSLHDTTFAPSDAMRRYWIAFRVAHPEPPVLDEPPVCPTCDGTGWVIDLNTQSPALCSNPDCDTVRAQRAERYRRLVAQAQIPREYEQLSFGDWETLLNDTPEECVGKRDALGAALAFVAARDSGFRFNLDNAAEQIGLAMPDQLTPFRCSLVLSGPNGVGKTSLAVSIARALLEQGVPVIYLRFAEFFDGIKDRFQDKPTYAFMPSAPDEAALLAALQQAPVLIIDEFYAEATDWRKERAEQLINYRYAHRMPTVITTNLSADRLTDLWGMTTGHRIQAMAHWIAMSGVELRQRGPEVQSR